MSEPRIEVVDGTVTRGDASALVARARAIPGANALLEWAPVRHAASARRLGSLVRESPRFAAADLLGLGGVRRYHLRQGGRPVLMRHGSVDVWTFDEIFEMRLYEPPSAVSVALERPGSPLVLDIGANIGMFGLDLLTRFPHARVVGYEPDAESAAIHRRLIELNGGDGAWELVEACAGVRDGTVEFLPGQETGSHAVEAPVPGSVTVPMVDVMDRFAEAALVKVDIEGGEWPLLADERFGGARAVVLEYHPGGCPAGDPATAARSMLEGHGFAVRSLFDHPGGFGMVWATRGG